MIVRIATEDQYRLPDEDAQRLNDLDNEAVAAVAAGDEDRFHEVFESMLDLVRLSFTDARTHEAAFRYTLGSFRTLVSDPDFPGMVGVTIVFVLASVGLQLAIGLALAVLIDSARRRRATSPPMVRSCLMLI